MYSYQGIMFDDANTEEEAKALLSEVLEAMAEAGYKPTGKEFVLVPGENDDVWEQNKKPVPYREMRHYIWDNHIASCGTISGITISQAAMTLLSTADRIDQNGQSFWRT